MKWSLRISGRISITSELIERTYWLIVYDRTLEFKLYRCICCVWWIFWIFQWQRSCYLDVFQLCRLQYIQVRTDPTFTFCDDTAIRQSGSRHFVFQKGKSRKPLRVGLLMTKGTIKLCLLSLFLWDMFPGIFIRGYSWNRGYGKSYVLASSLPFLLVHKCKWWTPVPAHSEDGICISFPMVSYFFGECETLSERLIRVQEYVLTITDTYPAVGCGLENSKIRNAQYTSRHSADQIPDQQNVWKTSILWRSWQSRGPKQKHEQGGPSIAGYYIIISAAPSLRKQFTIVPVLSETVASYNAIVSVALPSATVEQLVTSRNNSTQGDVLPSLRILFFHSRDLRSKLFTTEIRSLGGMN